MHIIVIFVSYVYISCIFDFTIYIWYVIFMIYIVSYWKFTCPNYLGKFKIDWSMIGLRGRFLSLLDNQGLSS